jgi:thiamine pyrophosphate-dependent acetolactate synthase large subunit-like protein
MAGRFNQRVCLDDMCMDADCRRHRTNDRRCDRHHYTEHARESPNSSQLECLKCRAYRQQRQLREEKAEYKRQQLRALREQHARQQQRAAREQPARREQLVAAAALVAAGAGANQVYVPRHVHGGAPGRYRVQVPDAAAVGVGAGAGLGVIIQQRRDPPKPKYEWVLRRVA